MKQRTNENPNMKPNHTQLEMYPVLEDDFRQKTELERAY